MFVFALQICMYGQNCQGNTMRYSRDRHFHSFVTKMPLPPNRYIYIRGLESYKAIFMDIRLYVNNCRKIAWSASPAPQISYLRCRVPSSNKQLFVELQHFVAVPGRLAGRGPQSSGIRCEATTESRYHRWCLSANFRNVHCLCICQTPGN